MIEDTSLLIDILNGEQNALEALSIAERERRPEKVAAITVLELTEGVERASKPEQEKAAVLEVLESKTVVPAGHDVMRTAGQISGELYESGTPIDREDCIVTATALREDEPVLTRNTEHFDRVSGLDVQTY